MFNRKKPDSRAGILGGAKGRPQGGMRKAGEVEQPMGRPCDRRGHGEANRDIRLFRGKRFNYEKDNPDGRTT